MNITAYSQVAAEQATSPQESDDKKYRVLVVDDVADNRDILSRRLVRRGYDVIEAEDGTSALEQIAEGGIDIVLLDIMMPDILGTEVVRQVRKTHSTSELPIIMVSAKSQSDDVAESLALGANDYVIKPIDFTITLARIESHLAQSASASAERRSRAAAETVAKELQATVEESLAALDQTNASLAMEAANRQRTEDKLQYMAYHDSLTQLSNRFAFLEQLEWALSDDATVARGLSALLIDLDRFKIINDAHGHQAGDKVLSVVAKRLGAAMPKQALCIARLGGDEFAALIPDDGDPDLVAEVGERVIDTVSKPIMIGDHHFQIGASCGIATTELCGRNASSLMKAADLAMYRAKNLGRGTVVTFEPSILEEQRQRNLLETSMPGALARGEFEVFYQPLINVDTGEISCFEALLRWQHPERGVISPTEFIPVAEDSGLIIKIGAWVLNQACAELKRWPETIRVAVNLSPNQFRSPDLVDEIRGALRAADVSAERLEVEITESCLLSAGKETVNILTTIRDLGVTVTIDDFGTGYSSMSYLQQFCFDKLKVDRRFVREADSNHKSAAIVDAIVGLSRKLGANTTVEGVETKAQLEVVVSNGCDELQGFLFSPPVPAKEALKFIEAHRSQILHMSK